ncbi:hypothetical protein [Streptomyces californicus]|uniref:hypothetical protein n=1 Tax=Streptomyces californicus TaxID=67351 RepID=UPI0037A5325A
MPRSARKRNWRPPHGLPTSIVLLATRDGWRHSVLTDDGATLCGGLPDTRPDATPQEARAAAVAMVANLARAFHATEVRVSWAPSTEPNPDTWTARIAPAAMAARPAQAPPESGGQTSGPGHPRPTTGGRR